MRFVHSRKTSSPLPLPGIKTEPLTEFDITYDMGSFDSSTSNPILPLRPIFALCASRKAPRRTFETICLMDEARPSLAATVALRGACSSTRMVESHSIVAYRQRTAKHI
jgi:hypothetical protein